MQDFRSKGTLSFIENNEEILNDEKTISMSVLGFQYFYDVSKFIFCLNRKITNLR